MSEHVDPKVNNEFRVWLNKLYGKHGKVTAMQGPVHKYLGMMFDFSNKGKLVVSMADYMKKLVDEFPIPITKTAHLPAGEDLFAEGKGPLLDA
jgi:hypothetical protein